MKKNLIIVLSVIMCTLLIVSCAPKADTPSSINTQPIVSPKESASKSTEPSPLGNTEEKIMYTLNGFSITPTDLWRKGVNDGYLYESVIPGQFVLYQYVPELAYKAMEENDIATAEKYVKDIAIVINNNLPIAEANKEILAGFDSKSTSPNNLLIVYNKNIDTTNLSEENIKVVSELNSDFINNILPQLESSDIPIDTASIEDGNSIVFSSIDIDGKPVTSEQLFSNNDITMITFWSTICAPCIKEMPKYEELYKNKADNVNVVGIVMDVGISFDQSLPTAIGLTEKNGVTYTNVIASDEMAAGLLTTVQFTPTTIFVDKNGKVIGDPISGGGRTAAQWEEILNERLALITAN